MTHSHVITVLFLLTSMALYCYSSQDTLPSNATESHEKGDPDPDLHLPNGAVSKLKAGDGVARERGGQAELRCNPSVRGADVTWYRNEKELTDGEKYSFSRENNSITIKSVGYDDIGVYQCEVNDELRVNVTLYSVPFVLNGKSINTNPGYNITIDCRVRGLPSAVVTWYGYSPQNELGQLIESDGKHYIMSNTTTTTNGQLTLPDLVYEDYKVYLCMATNEFGSNNGTTLVRVKKPYRAVWPIIGILVQVLVLAVIIYFYERRKKKEMEIEKRREAEFNKSHPVDAGHDAGIRQRKST